MVNVNQSTDRLDPPKLVQIALCSADQPRSVQFYMDVFGFANAGGDCLYGPWPAALQELGVEDMSGMIWWLTGRQAQLQLEIFHHNVPEQRPQPADWRPSDHGWVRWGVAVSDFDGCVERLARKGVPTFTDPVDFGDGVRRVCFQDPLIGNIVEILEDGPNMPGGIRARHFKADPAVIYITLSVPRMDRARAFFVEGLCFDEQPDPNALHTPEMEGLWGLDGAERAQMVVRSGEVLIELVCYANPVGRPKPADYRLSDQGIMNCALSYRERDKLEAMVTRLEDMGATCSLPLPPPGAPAAVYMRTPDGTSIEMGAVSAEIDPYIGFVPRPDLMEMFSR